MRRVVLAVLVLLALFYGGGGGWYFAGQIESDGLPSNRTASVEGPGEVRILGRPDDGI